MRSLFVFLLGWMLCGHLLAADRPNVLFIAVDDMRCELGCYGTPHVKTPQIDRLAASGVVFRNAYCQQAVCNPSRASLMTGLRPDSTKVWDLVTDFRNKIPEAVTIPQHFRQHGYRAIAFGKIFHNTFPDDVSWDEPTHRAKNTIAYSPENQQRLEDYRKQMKLQGKSLNAIEKMRGPATEIQDQPEEKNYDGKQTLDAIEKLHELQQHPEPFFLAIGFIRPHLPWITPKKYWDLYDRASIPLAKNGFLPQGAPEVAFGSQSLGGFYELRGYLDYADAPSPFERPLSEDQQRELKHGYYASVTFVDAQIGKLLDALDAMQLSEKTIVILWSDHGWKLGEHGGWCKQTNYEIDTHVPMIIRKPGAKENGKASFSFAEFVDVYPTLCELASLPKPNGLEGMSLAPVLENVQHEVKPAAFSQFERRHLGKQFMGYAMRTRDYRYVEWLDAVTGTIEAAELYDHRVDPEENHNLASMPEHADRLKQLNQQLWTSLPRPKFPHEVLNKTTVGADSTVRVELAWQPIEGKTLPESKPQGEYRSVEFGNDRDEAIELWWMGPTGNRQSFGVIPKGGKKSIRTRRGAVWLVTDRDQKSLGYFVTKDSNATATVPLEKSSVEHSGR